MNEFPKARQGIAGIPVTSEGNLVVFGPNDVTERENNKRERILFSKFGEMDSATTRLLMPLITNLMLMWQDPQPNHWEIVTGGMKQGETVVNAITREAREERAIELLPDQIIMLDPAFQANLLFLQIRKGERTTFTVSASGVVLTDQQLNSVREHQPYKEVDPTQLPGFLADNANLLRPATMAVLLNLATDPKKMTDFLAALESQKVYA